jgi:hypothetical protein
VTWDSKEMIGIGIGVDRMKREMERQKYEEGHEYTGTTQQVDNDSGGPMLLGNTLPS